jgi:hypothetical protein
VNQGTSIDTIAQSISEACPSKPFCKPIEELTLDLLVHKNPIGRNTYLTADKQLKSDKMIDRYVQIGIWQNNKRGVAPQLQQNLLDTIGTIGKYRSSCPG